MCCFSLVNAPSSWLGRLFGAGRIHVSETSIFARMAGPDTQLLVYSIARRRGLNVDQPRNLAKTVTVE